MKKLIALCGAMTLVLSSFAAAQHAADIELEVAGGRITLSGSVFAAELGKTFTNYTNEPGFDSEPGTFPTGTQVGFNILDALRTWNGSDFSTFGSATMAISNGPATVTTPTTADSFVPGFGLNVSANGQWHQHLGYTLDEPATDGVYLLTLELYNSDPGIATSGPFFVVFNQNVDAVIHDDAIAYVETNLVPEPAALSLLAVAALTARRPRRR